MTAGSVLFSKLSCKVPARATRNKPLILCKTKQTSLLAAGIEAKKTNIYSRMHTAYVTCLHSPERSHRMQFLRRPDHPTSRRAADLQALLWPKRHIDQQILNGLTAPRNPAALWSTNRFKAPRCKSQSWRLSLHTFRECHGSVGKMSSIQ